MNNIWESFKKHPMYKIGAVYAATAFVIIEFTNIVFPALHLPDWSETLVVLLVIIGFPITLVFSWATFPKHGEAQTDSSMVGTSSADNPLQRITWKHTTILTVILLFIFIAGYLLYNHISHSNTTISDNSIAVLPFKNLSDNKDDEYFTEGMTDELLGDLSKMSGLKVLSRTSTEQYKNTTKTMKEIGAELGVEILLEGSVHKIGDDLRVIVQLINAKTDEHIWARTYNRKIKDLFALQSEVAQAIASELGHTLLPGERKNIESRPTKNVKAYDYYLQGIKYSDSYNDFYDKDDEIKGEMMFRAALGLDPGFIEAMASLSFLYVNIAWYNKEAYSYTYNAKGKAVVDSIIGMNVDKPCVHEALGNYKFKCERNYPDALKEYGIASKEDPGNSNVLIGKSNIFIHLGLLDSALLPLKNAEEINPNTSAIFEDISSLYGMQRKPDEALSYSDKAIALAPDNYNYYISKAIILTSLKGDIPAAKKVLDEAKTKVNPDKLADAYNYLDFLQANYSSTLAMLLRYPDSIDFEQGYISPFSEDIALIYIYENKPEIAKDYFIKAKNQLIEKIKTTPGDYRLYGALGIAYAGSKENKEAIENGNHEREIIPPSKDALIDVNIAENLALIYTLLGNQEDAIKLLEQEMKMPFGQGTTNTIPMLKISPQWIPLHSNPGFKKLEGVATRHNSSSQQHEEKHSKLHNVVNSIFSKFKKKKH